MSWSQLPTISASMPFQMALDEVLFRSLEDAYHQNPEVELSPLFRFYFSSEPWISVGYSHKEDVSTLTSDSASI